MSIFRAGMEPDRFKKFYNEEQKDKEIEAVSVSPDKTGAEAAYIIKANGADDREEFFEKQYAEFVNKKNELPSMSDCYAFGFNPITLRKYMKRWKGEEKVRIVRDGYKRKVVWKGYEDYAKVAAGLDEEIGHLGNMASGARSNNGSGLLSSPFIKGYISEVLGNPGSEELSKEAIEIIGLFGSDTARATDEKISEALGLTLNRTRHHLTILKETGIFFYDAKDGIKPGWKTYYWGFSGLENLRNCYVSDTKKRIKELEEEIRKKSAKPKYVCEKFGEKHPEFDFDSDSVVDSGYKCADCNEPLIFKTGEELIKPLEEEISILKESIEEVNKINLNGAEKAVNIGA